jgi:hypothetical protein
MLTVALIDALNRSSLALLALQRVRLGGVGR